MKKKNVLRLLAFVMAASLTVTSAPAGLFSGTETVYAADASGTAKLNTSDFTETATTISINANVSSTEYFTAVESGVGKTSADATTWKQGNASGTASLVAENLEANTAYDIYRASADSDASNDAVYLCTVTTEKLSLADTSKAEITKLEVDTDNDANAGHAVSGFSLVYNGKAQEPYAVEVKVPGDGANSASTVTLTPSQIASNFTYSYDKNTDVGTNATVTLTAKDTSKYQGSITATFEITQFDLTDANTQIKIGGAVYGPSNIKSFPYDGTGQDSVLKTIEVSVDLDGDNTFETKLTRNTDYTIDFTTVSENTTAGGDKTGLNLTTDVGRVTLAFSGMKNYKSTTAFKAVFDITQATPDTPTKPTVTATGDLSFEIDITDEDQRYTYEYMILTEDDLNKTITWPASATITSAAVVGSTTKASKIKIETESSGSTYATVGATKGSALTQMDGSTSLVLKSTTKYYVVRRIANTENVKGTTTSEKAEVKTKKRSLSSAVGSTNYNSSANTTAGDIGAKEKSGLGKTYDGKEQKDATVILYVDNTGKGSTLEEGNDYTIEYYNVPTATAAGSLSSYADCVSKGRKGDKKNAGTVYIWAVGNGDTYYGELLIGYYVIAQADIILTVQNSSKPYDGNDTITGLKAEGTFSKSGETVSVDGLTGKTTNTIVGNWGISDSDADLTVPATAKYSDNASNFKIAYSVENTKVEIKKATVQIQGDNITIAYGQTLTLSNIKTNVDEVTKALKYTLNYGKDTDVNDSFTLANNTGVLTLTLKDYAKIKDAKDITITASLTGVQATTNYDIGTTSKVFTVTIKPAELQVGFGADTDDDGVINVTSYTRRTEVQKKVEDALAQSITGNSMDSALSGIPATSGKSARKSELTVGNGTNYYFVTTGSTNADITYKYYTSDGKTELYDIPTADGTYIVKAFLKANETNFAGNVVGTDGSDPSKYSGMITLKIGGGNASSTGSSSGVSDYYENTDDGKIYDKNDQLVTNQVVNLDGTDKYVDSNGNIVYGKVLQDNADGSKTYAIAKDGSLIKNNKTTIGGKDYVTDEEGAIYKDQLATTPSGNQVYVGKDGAVVKNQVVTVNKKKYYANSTGRIVKNGFFNTKRGNKVYADKNGVLKVGVVFTVKGYKYYAGTNGAIATNGLTKTKSGNTVFATSSGKLKVNKTFTYKGVKYKANKKGVVTKVK